MRCDFDRNVQLEACVKVESVEKSSSYYESIQAPLCDQEFTVAGFLTNQLDKWLTK